MSTQKQDLLNYLNSHGSITRMEAFSELGICELSSRIGELEAQGYVFPRQKHKGKSANGRKWCVTRYLALDYNEQLRNQDTAVEWTGEGGLMSRAADQIERLLTTNCMVNHPACMAPDGAEPCEYHKDGGDLMAKCWWPD